MSPEVLTDMPAVARGFLLVLFSAFAGSSLTAQNATPTMQQVPADAIFTISVAPPTPAKDVQVRYFLTDESGVRWSSTAAAAGSDKLVIHADSAGRTPKTFNAIAYAPGCQFVTFTAQDLASSTRKGSSAQCADDSAYVERCNEIPRRSAASCDGSSTTTARRIDIAAAATGPRPPRLMPIGRPGDQRRRSWRAT